MDDRMAIRIDSMVRGRRHRMEQGFRDSRARDRSETSSYPLPQYIGSKVNRTPESRQKIQEHKINPPKINPDTEPKDGRVISTVKKLNHDNMG